MPWHRGAVPRGHPLESPAIAPPPWRRLGSTPPRARWVAASQQRRATDAGYAAAPGPPDLRGGRPPTLRRDAQPARLRRPWRAARSSARGVVRGAPDRLPRRCGPRAARGSRLPARSSLAATPRCQGFRGALDTAGTPVAVSPAAGEATVTPDGRGTPLVYGRPRGDRWCGLWAAIARGLAPVHHR